MIKRFLNFILNIFFYLFFGSILLSILLWINLSAWFNRSCSSDTQNYKPKTEQVYNYNSGTSNRNSGKTNYNYGKSNSRNEGRCAGEHETTAKKVRTKLDMINAHHKVSATPVGTWCQCPVCGVYFTKKPNLGCCSVKCENEYEYLVLN